tara:strand:+ start:4353 stop:4754 length:402 start_codon:yes stop_codon:yes gene_type:complete
MKRITNIDTLSAYLDRLITERIKWFFFKKENKVDRVKHQEIVIGEIKNKISELFLECFDKGSYEYINEKRTFDEVKIIEELDELIINDINIGESDRERLEIAMINEKRLRKANEGRAKNKNNIDDMMKEFLNE